MSSIVKIAPSASIVYQFLVFFNLIFMTLVVWLMYDIHIAHVLCVALVELGQGRMRVCAPVPVLHLTLYSYELQLESPFHSKRINSVSIQETTMQSFIVLDGG